MFTVVDSFGNKNVFTDYETACVFLDSLGDAAQQLLSIYYDCVVDNEVCNLIYVKGRERDRLVMYDRIIFSAEIINDEKVD
jgi:hypothetical protein